MHNNCCSSLNFSVIYFHFGKRRCLVAIVVILILGTYYATSFKSNDPCENYLQFSTVNTMEAIENCREHSLIFYYRTDKKLYNIYNMKSLILLYYNEHGSVFFPTIIIIQRVYYKTVNNNNLYCSRLFSVELNDLNKFH